MNRREYRGDTRCIVGHLLVSLLVLPLALSAALAQQGSLQGRITIAGTAASLIEARVHLPRTNIGAIANADGRHAYGSIAPGTMTVRVIRVGYLEQQKVVDVVAGEITTLDFALTRSALNRDPIVITATGDQRKIKLGPSVSSIEAATRVEETPISCFRTWTSVSWRFPKVSSS